MENLALINVANHGCMTNVNVEKNGYHFRNATIVQVFPQFSFVPYQKDESFVEFCWSHLILYKTFHDFHRDVDHTTDKIVQNWENFQYRPWHVDCNMLPSVHQHDSSKEEEDPNP